MAAACASGEETVSEVSDIVCPVCLEPYKDPKALSCGHSLCETCAQKLSVSTTSRLPRFLHEEHRVGFGRLSDDDMVEVEEITHKIRCPQCRAITTAKNRGLPTNYQLKELLSCLKSEEKKKKRLCKLCDNQLPEREFWHCISCREEPQNYFCSKCGLKSHNGHEMTELSEIMIRKWAANDNIIVIKSETETSVNRIRTKIGVIQQNLTDVVQLLDSHCTDRFNRVLSRLQAVELSSDEMLNETVAQAKRAQDDINAMCRSVDTSQSTALVELVVCLRRISKTVEAKQWKKLLEKTIEVQKVDFGNALESTVTLDVVDEALDEDDERFGDQDEEMDDNRPASPTDSTVVFCPGRFRGGSHPAHTPNGTNSRPVNPAQANPAPPNSTPSNPDQIRNSSAGRGNSVQRGPRRRRGQGARGSARPHVWEMETTHTQPFTAGFGANRRPGFKQLTEGEEGGFRRLSGSGQRGFRPSTDRQMTRRSIERPWESGQRGFGRPSDSGQGVFGQPSDNGQRAIERPWDSGHRGFGRPSGGGHGQGGIKRPSDSGQGAFRQHSDGGKRDFGGQGAFGQPSDSGQVSFGQRGFGGQGAFGQSSDSGQGTFRQHSDVGKRDFGGQGAFEQPSDSGQGGFGQPSDSGQRGFGGQGAFGQSSDSGQGAFGQPSDSGQGGFGQPSDSGQRGFGGQGAFGQSSDSGQGAFGQPPDSGQGGFGGQGAFGQSYDSGQGAFGQPSDSGQGAFGQPSDSGQGAFGQPPDSGQRGFGGQGAFGQPSDSGQGAFGQPPDSGQRGFGGQGAFGQPSDSGQGDFGQPSDSGQGEAD